MSEDQSKKFLLQAFALPMGTFFSTISQNMYFRPMIQHGYLLGLDIGSSSVKASLVEVRSGRSVASSQSPSSEMSMIAVQSGWAEQNPEMWWEHVVNSTKLCLQKSQIKPESVLAIG